jgi:predicted O-linked N-acetylglucosamine transferase (SPINDLY family)
VPDVQPTTFTVSLLGHETHELLAAGVQCLASGAAADAEALFHTAAIKRPWDPEIRYQLASAQIAGGKLDDALRTLAEAREQHARLMLEAHAPDALRADADPQMLLKLAETFYGANQVATAASLYQRLVDSHPDVPELRLGLGLSLQHQGRMDEAIGVFEALERRWSNPQYHSLLHYALAFQRPTPDAMYREGLRYAARHTARLPKSKRRLSRVNGKLRVGYFSQLFNEHQVTKFFQPVIEHHDRSRFSLVCYSGAASSDETGSAIRDRVDLWRDVAEMDDEKFALQVAIDEVDIRSSPAGRRRSASPGSTMSRRRAFPNSTTCCTPTAMTCRARRTSMQRPSIPSARCWRRFGPSTRRRRPARLRCWPMAS